MTVREANQNFSRLIAAVESGETVVITKRGAPVARITPQPPGRSTDALTRAAIEDLQAGFDTLLGTDLRVGVITEDDLYGDDQ